MAKRVVGFTLTPDTGGSNGYSMTQTSGDPVLDPNSKNGVKLAKDHHYYMNFTLGDSSLSFDGKRDEVFLVRAGDTCPDRGEVTGNSNFKKSHMKFKNNGRELEIRDDNVDPGSFAYRILIKQGNQPRDFDPVIINGGGGQEPFTGWLTLLLGFGTGLVAMTVAYYTGLLARILG